MEDKDCLHIRHSFLFLGRALEKEILEANEINFQKFSKSMHDAAFMDCNKPIWQYRRNIPNTDGSTLVNRLQHIPVNWLIIMDKVSQNINEQLCIKLQSSYYGQCVNPLAPEFSFKF
jgi:hypothetical protein